MSAAEKRSVYAILVWMRRNAARFVDECDEVNMTAMVEAWDRECDDGGATLDEDHPAWACAFEVSEEYDRVKGSQS